jgi:ABC-2 type transport system ATP-binding protein
VSDRERNAVLRARDLEKSFSLDSGEVVRAVDRVSLEAAAGTLTALVGPDGAGKTTFIRLAAGLLTPNGGELKVLGMDVSADPQSVQDRISYMPQKFGLYEDLTVLENLDLYADLHGVTAQERRAGYPRLMEMTALGPFTERLAGRLSGGMKQKLGLACTLVRAPELLLLDEPTVGVDPLSRRELWEIILQLVREQGLSVLLSTSYLDEAEHCDHTIVMHQGTVLAQGHPTEVSRLAAGRAFLADPPAGRKAREFQARLLDEPGVIDAVPEGGRVRLVLDQTMKDESRSMKEDNRASPAHPSSFILYPSVLTPVPPRFEDGFMVLLRQQEDKTSTSRQEDRETGRQGDTESRRAQLGDADRERSDVVVYVRDLVRQFGNFTAVDHISFDVRRGEIFGLLGPNGAGKTTTFRMLCGLLPATSGILRVAGADLRRARASARQRIGYVAQKFSLYGQLSVIENLEFFASAYGLRGARKQARIDWALQQLELASLADLPSGNLPGGFKQRLAMAAALLHEPEILFLDEPTSGADPLARREFWRRITALAEGGVTVVVTTHFMEEAEYCDRIAIMDAGRILAQGTPVEIRQYGRSDERKEPTMEDAFIAIVEEARKREGNGGAAPKGAA